MSKSSIPILLPLAKQSIDYYESYLHTYHSSLPNETSRLSNLVVSNDSFLLKIYNKDVCHQ
jgi:hypothetical protein